MPGHPFAPLNQDRACAPSGELITRSTEGNEARPPRDVERIFDKFYRAKGAGTGVAGGTFGTAAGGADSQRAGTGLGLAICRGFVEAMDGTISAANRADRPGAVITISLPVPFGATLPEETMT